MMIKIFKIIASGIGFLTVVLAMVNFATANVVGVERDMPATAVNIPLQYILTFHNDADMQAKEDAFAIINQNNGKIIKQLPLINGWAIQLPESAVNQLRDMAMVAALQPDSWLNVLEMKGICTHHQHCSASEIIQLLGEIEDGSAVVVLNVEGLYSQPLTQAIAQAKEKELFFITPASDWQQSCFTTPASSPDVLTVGSTQNKHDFDGCIDLILSTESNGQAVEEVAELATKYLGAGMTIDAIGIELDAIFSDPLLCDTRIYVDGDATGANDGSSWLDAYIDLQSALAAVTPCPAMQAEIWVASGVYYPDEGVGQTNNSRNATFTLVDDVAIYGGFDGSETNRMNRNWHTNITVLSGDIEQNDNTTITGIVTDTTQINGNNSYTIVTGSGANNNAVLDGFTITAGYADGVGNYPAPDRRGGGLYAAAGQFQATNLHLLGNSATGNGAILGYGGGVYLLNGSTVSLLNVRIAGNVASGGGGGIYYTQSDVQLINTLIAGNIADDGGAVYSDLSTGTFINGTFVSNFATDQGSVLRAIYSSNTTIQNSIFWDNTTSSGNSADQTISHASGSSAVLDYNLVETGCGTSNVCTNDVVGNPAFLMPITGSLAPTTLGDFHVDRFISVIIDAGHDAYVPAGVNTDLDGNDRIEGLDAYPVQDVDLGAYEFNLPELNIIGTVATNGDDLDISWTNTAEACVWVIYRDINPYFTPQWGVNNVGMVCDALQCYSGSFTLLNAISDISENDYITVRPDECINVFGANEIGVFHFTIVPGAS